MNLATTHASIWHLAHRDNKAEDRLCSELGVPALVAAVLAGRGYHDPAVAEHFLAPSLADLHRPNLLPDYERAVEEILGARERKEKIFVHGDYDVDGVTSAALFARFLGKIGCDVVAHVPHRMREGYGIHIDAVQAAHQQGARLFLTCDCGVSAHEQVKAAHDLGMKVVVTDHHEVGEALPEAEAVVNPHRSDSEYPWPNLSGVGVVFKLCAGITEELGWKLKDYYRAYLDLAVLGTVADVMPLLGENRVITKFGLERLVDTKKAGLRALLEVADLSGRRRLTARHIGFQLGPRINAVGRIDDASVALDLLMTEDVQEARRLAAILDKLNEERRSEQERMFEQAVEEALQGEADPRAIVVAREGWHAGIIGIVAGKLVERFRRPAFVIALGEDGSAKGSARSVEGFNLASALDSARALLVSGGGHEMAAGFSLERANITGLATALRSYAEQALRPEDCLPRFHVDAVVEGAEAGPETVEDLNRLEPFGQANPEPLFATMSARIRRVSPTSNPDHVRLDIEANDGTNRQAMAFGIGRALADQDLSCPLDLAFTLEESLWRGETQFRWIVRDYRPSSD